MPTLLEAIRDLDLFDREDTIYAAEPWSASSQAIVAREPTAGGLPSEARKLRLKYFLEVCVASEVLEALARSLDAEPTPQQSVARLIQYARTDA